MGMVIFISFIGLFVHFHITSGQLAVTLNPSSVSLREDTTLEQFLSHVTPSGVSAGDSVSCSVLSVSPTSSNFFAKINSSTTNYAVYCQALPTGLSYSTTPSYTITVRCQETISSNTATATLSVNLIQNQPPAISNLPSSVNISSQTTTVGTSIYTVTTTDSEGDQLYYGFVCDPTGCPFQIQESGEILVTADLSGTTQTGYDVKVSVNDSRNSDGPKILTVTITDINSPPSFSNAPSSAIIISENVALSTQVYGLSVTDANAADTHTFTATYTPADGINYFSIDTSSGVISTSSTNNINYESLSAVTTVMKVTVTDGQDTATTTVSITVSDVNEAPVFPKTNYLLSADESSYGATAGSPSFGVTDPDGDSLTYSMSCTDFAYNSATGIVTFAVNYDLDVAGAASSVTCTVTASDGSLTSTATLTIDINNINDNTPTLDQPAYTFIVSSTTAVGTTITTVTAIDNDAAPYGTVTYYLDQTSVGNEYFSVSSSGVITLKTSLSAFSSGDSMSLTLTATDSGGLTASSPFTVVIPATTTAGSTTTTEGTKTFFDDSRNIAWFTAAVVLGVVVAGIACYVCFKKFNARKFDLQKKERKDQRLEYPGDPWNPWKIWEHS